LRASLIDGIMLELPLRACSCSLDSRPKPSRSVSRRVARDTAVSAAAAAQSAEALSAAPSSPLLAAKTAAAGLAGRAEGVAGLGDGAAGPASRSSTRARSAAAAAAGLARPPRSPAKSSAQSASLRWAEGGALSDVWVAQCGRHETGRLLHCSCADGFQLTW
jgi:hypothetical protein